MRCFPLSIEFRRAGAGLALAIVLLPGAARAAADEATFSRVVQPFLKAYCLECHSTATSKGGVDLEMFSSATVFEEHPTKIDHMVTVLDQGDMPPRRAKQPTEAEKAAVIGWLNAELARQQNVLPNDPGPVVMPRINSKEYDYVVRDLTAKDLSMGQFLMADTGGGEGFLNVGAALPMQVGNFEGFLSTAKKLLGHARILPNTGIVWFQAPQPPVADEESLQKAALVAVNNWFAEQHSVHQESLEKAAKAQKRSLASLYAEAAWRYQNRAALRMPQATLAEIAATYDPPLYPDSIAKLLALMTKDPAHAGVFKEIADNPLIGQWVQAFAALPKARGPQDLAAGQAAIAKMDQMRADVLVQDTEFGTKLAEFELPPKDQADGQAKRGMTHRGEFPFTLDLTKVKGSELYLLVTTTWDGSEGDFVSWRGGEFTLADGSRKPWATVVRGFTDSKGKAVAFGSHAGGDQAEPDEVVVGSGTWLKFAVPPGAKQLTLQARLDPRKGKEATVQVAVLDQPPTPEMLTAVRARPILGGGLGSARIKRCKGAISQFAYLDSGAENIRRIRPGVIYAGLPAEMRASLGIKDAPVKWSHWSLTSASRDDVVRLAPAERQAELATIEKLLADVVATKGQPAGAFTAQADKVVREFTTRAWRRPPTSEELAGLMALFQAEAGKGATYEAAVKAPLTAVLVSAPFLYRFTVARGSDKPYPIQGTELATRLAFLLWASLPDHQLLELGSQGRLQDPAVLNAQIRRMLADPRAEAFVEQFLGVWLGFADFDEFAGPDAMKFDVFSEPLRKAMHDEVKLFFLDLLRTDAPITTALNADYTFANDLLTKHYGLPRVEGSAMRKVSVPADQRGGILGMGAFLTKYSKPLRTSPVHRGIWVHEYVLGQKLGEPPPNVPQLSDEEKNEAGLTVAQQLAEHRRNPACFSCHDKFDPLGVALENFDPVGRWRTTTAGSPVDTRGEFGNGTKVDGFPALKQYVLERRDLFVETFCRKLLGYALGRSLLPTDAPLLDQTVAAMKAGGNRPSTALAQIVGSQQFRYRRDDMTPSTTAAR